MEKEGSCKRPFLIYRINSEEAYQYAIKICQYILTSFHTQKLYIEHPNEINVQSLFPNDLILQEKYKNKIEHFDIKTENSDLCIIQTSSTKRKNDPLS